MNHTFQVPAEPRSASQRIPLAEVSRIVIDDLIPVKAPKGKLIHWLDKQSGKTICGEYLNKNITVPETAVTCSRCEAERLMLPISIIDIVSKARNHALTTLKINNVDAKRAKLVEALSTYETLKRELEHLDATYSFERLVVDVSGKSDQGLTERQIRAVKMYYGQKVLGEQLKDGENRNCSTL